MSVLFSFSRAVSAAIKNGKSTEGFIDESMKKKVKELPVESGGDDRDDSRLLLHSAIAVERGLVGARELERRIRDDEDCE